MAAGFSMLQAQSLLKQYWGYDSFRGIQREIIESIGAGRDTLGLMPTGGGKSVTFQVPALALEGVCVVVTPLISLMNDQIVHLRERGVRAAAIHSGMSRNEIITTLENCIFGTTKLLYVSPERIGSELFLKKIKRVNVSFITVDEAHCISQWGYDFRPSYLHIADLRKLKPDVPILALTATATPDVVEDIQKQLAFRQENAIKMSFKRDNLAYVVRHTDDKMGQLVHILNTIEGSSIVYVRSRKRTQEIAQELQKHGISADSYHAGLEHTVKNKRQEAWNTDRTRVIVATTAFGMGIDKPDVRLVIHYDLPSSPEEYFQEAGRGGRDGKRAYAVQLVSRTDDMRLMRRLNETFPDKEYIKKVYDCLAYYYSIAVGSGGGHSFMLDTQRFMVTYKLAPILTESALHILSTCGYIDYEEDPNLRARLRFLLTRSQLDTLNHLSPLEQRLVTELLRCYGSLFVDYTFIDLADIAERAEMTTHEAYQLLRGLTMRRILHFIPQRNEPIVTYLCDREDHERLVIPPEVYEERRTSLQHRLEAMAQYAKNSDICRSRYLLAYFGETESEDCGKCDVCLSRRKQTDGKQKLEDAKRQVRALLSDGKHHALSEINSLNIPDKYLTEALDQMSNDEEIGCHAAGIWLTR